MSKYKLTFRLKQHTPMIHFQANQHGATLRASELKPKLDRFIIEQEGLTAMVDGKEVQKEEYTSWFISKQHLALDYQVKIKATEIKTSKIRKDIDRLPTFFANMGDDYEPLYLTQASQITVEIIVMIGELKYEIEKSFGEFLIGTNFGMRQSKGFGSFSLEKYHFNQFNFNVSFDIETNKIPSDLWRRNNGLLEDWNEIIKLFGAIEVFYKNLRSGINRKGANEVSRFYIKPAIFYYAKLVLKKQWDKKSIKENYLNHQLKKQQEKHNYSDVITFSDSSSPNILIKDVFGLSSSEDWIFYKKKLEKHHSSIERLQSPLIFKPIKISTNKYKVGIICHPISPDFLGALFSVSFGGREQLELKVPDEFLWSGFWRFYLDEMPKLDERLGGVNKEDEQSEYKILSQIENSLQALTP